METTVLETGENDLCITSYSCRKCDCESIEDWMSYCPSCGAKIIEFQSRCSSQKDKHDKGLAELSYHSGDYSIQCVLASGHRGKHEGHDYVTRRKNTWRDA